MTRVRRWVLAALVGIGMLISGLLWRPASAAEYPAVADLQKFSAESKFMSLPGYLRWLMFQQDGVWISRAEAARIVKTQEHASGH